MLGVGSAGGRSRSCGRPGSASKQGREPGGERLTRRERSVRETRRIEPIRNKLRSHVETPVKKKKKKAGAVRREHPARTAPRYRWKKSTLLSQSNSLVS